MLTVLFALLAGALTVAAPCTLPVLPILLGASVGRTGSARPVFIALGFVVSFAAVTVVFSAITRIVGVDQNTLRTIAIIVLIAFGLMMLWPGSFNWVSTFAGAMLRRPDRTAVASHPGNIGGLVLGTTLGLVWTPCAGPVLGSILAVIATSSDIRWEALLLVVYAIGAAVPMLAIAYGGQFVSTRIRSVARISDRLRQGFGMLIILFAASMYFEFDASITAWFSGFYPNGQVGL